MQAKPLLFKGGQDDEISPDGGRVCEHGRRTQKDARRENGERATSGRNEGVTKQVGLMGDALHNQKEMTLERLT